MYQGSGTFAQLWFGFSTTELFLRLDPLRGAEWNGELRLLLSREQPSGREERTLRMTLRVNSDCPVLDEKNRPCGRGRCGAIVELSLSLGALGLAPGDRLLLLARLVLDDVEVDRLPRYGELDLSVPDKGFERTHWQV